MNIYICSTVRHLLFALLKASQNDSEQHHILFFSDFQQASLHDWNLGSLPESIVVHDVQRADFRAQLGSRWQTRLYYYLAMRNLAAPAPLQQAFLQVLARTCPVFGAAFAAARHRSLWLFNERNKMARLFRLTTPRFSVIEEGAGNYLGVHVAAWKKPLRLLLGRPPGQWYFGEDRRCDAVWVQHPDKLPAYVRHKGRRIDFFSDRSGHDLVLQLFPAQDELRLPANTVILATSPVDDLDGISKEQKLRLFRLLADQLETQGYAVRIKPHPRENSADYAEYGERLLRSTAKLPLELFILASDAVLTVVSPYTSAGIGMEAQVRPVQLLSNPADRGAAAAEIKAWLEQPPQLRARLEQQLSAATRS